MQLVDGVVVFINESYETQSDLARQTLNYFGDLLNDVQRHYRVNLPCCIIQTVSSPVLRLIWIKTPCAGTRQSHTTWQISLWNISTVRVFPVRCAALPCNGIAA